MPQVGIFLFVILLSIPQCKISHATIVTRKDSRQSPSLCASKKKLLTTERMVAERIKICYSLHENKASQSGWPKYSKNVRPFIFLSCKKSYVKLCHNRYILWKMCQGNISDFSNSPFFVDSHWTKVLILSQRALLYSHILLIFNIITYDEILFILGWNKNMSV